MDEEFYRMKRLPPYVIAEVNAMRAAARAGGRDIIDLGMGNPDLPPPQHVIDKLCEVAMKPTAHGYSASRGIPGVRKAQAKYYARRFGVELDPETEVVMTLGSKEGLASLATAITAPGDVVLAPNPSYPIHTFGFIIAGATIRSVPTTPDERYWESLDRAMRYSVPRPSVLIVNYPSNPTAETVDLAFYERLVAWARENKVWVLSDLAYSELYFDGHPTRSILEVPGAKDVAVEFTSMSKTFSMAGWRVGFAVGNTKLIAALTRVKSYLDYGAFTPIQAATCAALNGPQDIVAKEPRALSEAPRCAGRKLWPRRMGYSQPARVDVRLGPAATGAAPSRQPGIFEAIADPGRSRGGAGRRLWRRWRRLCADRDGRERTAPAPGGAQYPPLSAKHGRERDGGLIQVAIPGI